MRKTIATITQILIFIGAWFVMTPDTLEDNTWVFGLIGSYDLVRGNSIWVLAGAAVLSVINIWLWWPKAQKIVKTFSEKAQEVTEAKEAKAIDQDPKTPTLD